MRSFPARQPPPIPFLAAPPGADKQACLARWEEPTTAVHDIVHAPDGSVSAEYGFGRLKVEEITHYKPGPDIEMMQAVKRALDPDGLTNPGKVVV